MSIKSGVIKMKRVGSGKHVLMYVALVIVGADPAGVMYGVYGLLEELRRALR